MSTSSISKHLDGFDEARLRDEHYRFLDDVSNPQAILDTERRATEADLRYWRGEVQRRSELTTQRGLQQAERNVAALERKLTTTNWSAE